MDVHDLREELRHALFRRVADDWAQINWAKFGARLRPPSFELMSSGSLLGRWQPARRVLGLSHTLVLEYAWNEVLATLEHEMAHQFVDEVLGGEAEPHGPLFRQVCRDRGIDYTARHAAGQSELRDEDDRIIARVQKLLALARSSNQHEAELAANMARRVMLRFNVQANHGARDDSSYTRITLGVQSGRISPHQYAVSSVLSSFFFVQTLWTHSYDVSTGKSGSILEIFGRPENLKMAEFVHAFLSETAERLWKDHKKTHGIKADKDRRAFLLGVIRGFSKKLEQDGLADAQEGLVWVPDAGLADYFRRRNPRIRSTSAGTVSNPEAYAKGREAGASIVLSKPISSSSDSDSHVPRALPRGR